MRKKCVMLALGMSVLLGICPLRIQAAEFSAEQLQKENTEAVNVKAADTPTEYVAINAANFPDENFRNYVKFLDGNLDGVLTADEIQGITEIWINKSQVRTLKGIEYFTALERLECEDNQISSMDVSNNTALKTLDCSGNQISSLDVSNHTALEILDCSVNQISSLDMSQNTALYRLECRYNQISSLNINNNTALSYLDCSGNLLRNLDVSKHTILETLFCWDNQLSSLDISNNTELYDLSCGNNRLDSLDISKNAKLYHLECAFNPNLNLDLSKSDSLTTLHCDEKQLSNLAINQIAETGLVSIGVTIKEKSIDMGKVGGFDCSRIHTMNGLTLDGSTFTIQEGKSEGSFGYSMKAKDGSSVRNVDFYITMLNADSDPDTPDEPEIPDIPEEPTKPDTPKDEFTDIPSNAYYATPVQWAVEKGITTGTSNTTFSPEKFCTRSQIVTFLWRAAGCPEPKSLENPFTDVKANAYYYKAVLWAVEQGITSGTSATTFSPETVCTRGQAVTFIYRYEGKPDMSASANPFTDVAGGQYYYQPVLWAVKEGITNGTSAAAFSPQKDCTRGQIVTFLYRDAN